MMIILACACTAVCKAAQSYQSKIYMKLLSHGSTKRGGGKVIAALPAGSFLTPPVVSIYWDISGRTSVGFSRFVFVPEQRKNVFGVLIAPCNPESVLGNGEEGSL